MTLRSCSRALALMFFVLPASAGAVRAGQDTPVRDSTHALSGAWIRNAELSDDPATAMRGARGGGPEGRPGGGGRAMGGRSGRPPETEGDRARMSTVMASPDRLTLTIGSGHVIFVDADGMSQTFATTNREEKHYFGNQMAVTRTKWDDGRLIREITFEGGVKRTETYVALAGEPRRLRLAIEVGGARLPREIKFQSTYDDARAR